VHPSAGYPALLEEIENMDFFKCTQKVHFSPAMMNGTMVLSIMTGRHHLPGCPCQEHQYHVSPLLTKMKPYRKKRLDYFREGPRLHEKRD
jgi:hypothetical protein